MLNSIGDMGEVTFRQIVALADWLLSLLTVLGRP
jgi:hypothetical protein